MVLQGHSIVVAAFQFLENVRVRRAEIILIDVCGADPRKRVVLQLLGKAVGNDAMEQGQPDHDIRVFVHHLHKRFPDFQRDSQFLLTLPYRSRQK